MEKRLINRTFTARQRGKMWRISLIVLIPIKWRKHPILNNWLIGPRLQMISTLSTWVIKLKNRYRSVTEEIFILCSWCLNYSSLKILRYNNSNNNICSTLTIQSVIQLQHHNLQLRQLCNRDFTKDHLICNVAQLSKFRSFMIAS